jgi:hypothetical protein
MRGGRCVHVTLCAPDVMSSVFLVGVFVPTFVQMLLAVGCNNYSYLFLTLARSLSSLERDKRESCSLVAGLRATMVVWLLHVTVDDFVVTWILSLFQFLWYDTRSCGFNPWKEWMGTKDTK